MQRFEHEVFYFLWQTRDNLKSKILNIPHKSIAVKLYDLNKYTALYYLNLKWFYANLWHTY